MDVFIPLIIDEIVEIVKVVYQERIVERICEQIVDVDGSQVAEQDTEVPKTSTRVRTLQRAAELMESGEILHEKVYVSPFPLPKDFFLKVIG